MFRDGDFIGIYNKGQITYVSWSLLRMNCEQIDWEAISNTNFLKFLFFIKQNRLYLIHAMILEQMHVVDYHIIIIHLINCLFQIEKSSYNVFAFIMGNRIHISEVGVADSNGTALRFLGYFNESQQECINTELVATNVMLGHMQFGMHSLLSGKKSIIEGKYFCVIPYLTIYNEYHCRHERCQTCCLMWISKF